MNGKAKAVFSGEDGQNVLFNISVDGGEMAVSIEFKPPLKEDEDSSNSPQVVLAMRFMEFLKQ